VSLIFKHTPWTVQELVGGVSSGTVRLPDIQRPFVWPNAKVRDLIDSMYRGYPVGELMFWANRDAMHTKTVGGDPKTQDATMQVVDGQQRLTSLYAVLKGLEVWREDYSRERISIAFNPLTERFEIPTPIVKRSSDWIADIVHVFANPIQARSDYLTRLKIDPTKDVDAAMEIKVELAINKLHQLQTYGFQVVQITDDVGRETVAEIFVRINSEGVTLSSADFILTWMSVFWEEGRTQLDAFARNSRFTPARASEIDNQKVTWTPHNPYLYLQPGQVLRVAIAVGLRRAKLGDAYNALRGRNPRTRMIEPASREIELAKLKIGQEQTLKSLHWDEFLKALERAGFRSRDMITSKNTVLYSYALWLIGRIDYGVPLDELREVMARWFFMSQMTGRYTSSPETRAQEDLNRLESVPTTTSAFIDVLNGQISTAVPSDWWTITLPDLLDTSSAGAPAYVAYIASLNILDADVLLSTSKVKDWISPTRRTVKGIEKHHLFPQDYLKTVLKLRTTKKINQVANFALVEWSDNIAISNKEPSVYWPQEVADKKFDLMRRTRQEEWHALPEGWTDMAYDNFLIQRRKLMASVTHEGYKRLTDPNYVPDLTRPLVELTVLDVSLPTLESLITSGVLPPGTLLTPVNEDRDTVAEITEDSYIKVGEHLCENPDRAAREDGADVDSGWDYWLAHLNGEPTLLAELRLQAAQA
jgi:hypothetical protein